MSSSTSRKVLLKSSDEALFEVEEAVALHSQTLKNLVEDTAPNSDAEIPLKNVRGCILAKIIEYCKKHVEGSDNVNLDALRTWDLEFVKVDLNILFDLMMAANFLDIRDLSDLTFQAAADMIKGKTPEEIRTIFNIKNDFTEDEENQIRKENQWAFE